METGKKDPFYQQKVLEDLIDIMESNSIMKDMIKGFMVESFIKDGSQKIVSKEEINLGGLSITDGCIGFEKTTELIEYLYDKL